MVPYYGPFQKACQIPDGRKLLANTLQLLQRKNTIVQEIRKTLGSTFIPSTNSIPHLSVVRLIALQHQFNADRVAKNYYYRHDTC
jgi:hypothetical protein